MALSLFLGLLIANLLLLARVRVHHQALDTVGDWVLDSLLLFLPLGERKKEGSESPKNYSFDFLTYIVVILFERLHIVEVVHDLFLVPAFDIGHIVDPSSEIAIIVIRLVLSIVLLVFDLSWMALTRQCRHHLFMIDIVG